MARPLTFARGVTEGAVIVVSVLLALAADAWWDGRQAVELEASVLAAVAQEVAANRTDLRSGIDLTVAMLERAEFFLQANPSSLASVPPDSVLSMVEAISRPLTFDPQSGAAPLLSQTAILSPAGVQVRTRVSEWLTRVSDADEEKEGLRALTNEVQRALGPYYARAAGYGRGTGSARLASLGPSILVDLRSDPSVVEAVVRRMGIQEVYLRNLEILSQVLDSVSAALEPS